MHFQLIYLRLILAYSKCQGEGHAHFDFNGDKYKNMTFNDDKYQKCFYCMLFKLSYLDLTLDSSKC